MTNQQGAPAAVAGCTRSHPHENMDSACRAKAAIAEMQNLAARGAEATAHDLARFVSMLTAALVEAQQPAPAATPGAVPDAAFAEAFAPGVGPLAGYIERLLQNGDGSRPARLAALALYERAASLFAG